MSRFIRTTGIVTALALTISTFSATSASAMYRGMGHAPVMNSGGHGMHGMRHHGMGGFGRAMAIGAGVGLGLMLLNAAAQANQNAQVEREIQGQIERDRVAKKAPKKPNVARKG